MYSRLRFSSSRARLSVGGFGFVVALLVSRELIFDHRTEKVGMDHCRRHPYKHPFKGKGSQPLFVCSSPASPTKSLQATAVVNKKSAPFHVQCKNGPHTLNPCQQFVPFNAPSTFTLPYPAMHCFCFMHFTLPSNIPAIHLAIPCHQAHPYQVFHPPFNIPGIYYYYNYLYVLLLQCYFVSLVQSPAAQNKSSHFHDFVHCNTATHELNHN